METGDKDEQLGSKNIHKNKVHKILAHSYIFYFLYISGLF